MSTGEQGSRVPQPIAPVRFWLKSALVIVVVGILLAWVWMPSRPKEPVYQGKMLREWLRALAEVEIGTQAHAQTEAALRKFGTNGIPTLLREIQTPDSNFRTMLKAVMQKQSYIESSFQDAEDIRFMASVGFGVLRDDAKGAVPELVTLVKRGSGTVGREGAIDALGYIGPSAQAAVPALLAVASDTKDPKRIDAIISLGMIHSSAESVVPFLDSCLRDPDVRIRMKAVYALSAFGVAAKSSVPTMIPLLSDPHMIVRRHATNALKHIDHEAATKAGIP